jgi:hypothetical protein
MRIFKTKWFARFARHEQILDVGLREAIERAERGLIDADLGGGLIKQRVARQGKGRSGGYRTIIAYRAKKRAVFLSAFAKSDQENIGADELLSLRATANAWMNANEADLRRELESGRIEEVDDGKENEQFG